MTKTERTCPRCGLVFASEKLDGLCPACLLGSLFDENDADDSKAFWEDEADADESLSDATPPTPVRRFSHFEILEELGRGGMGIVYRARDVGTGRIIALKVLQAHHLEVPDLVTRFRSEVRAVTSLDHPNVLPVHEVGEYEGIPFFSMKLTTGGSLAQRVGDYLGKPIEIARLLAKVARGVAHAHERGILHRDLKPGNILLDAAGEPYVCDFGLAKWIEDDRNLTITSAVLGTPHYIAPEQASGKKGLTTAADIYSLGAIIYELLTARPPFVGQSIIETLRLASENTPERPSSLAQNIPKDLETICLKCLEREPASRYVSATALAIDLENWIEGRPILARPVGAAEQLWRWARRNPLPAALIASVAMLLVATAVVATVSAVRIEKSLHTSLIAQARASLLTGRAGRSLTAIEALRDAAKIHPTFETRNLAIQALSLSDIEVNPKSWKIGPNSRPSRSFDSKLLHIAEEMDKGVVRILRLADEKEIMRFEEPELQRTPIDRIVYSPDDRFVAARHNDGIVKVWDVATRKKRYELRCASIEKAPWYAPNFAFSTTGAFFAVALPTGGAAIHDTESGKELNRLESTEIFRCVAFSPDDHQLSTATYGNRQLSLWDIGTDQLIRTLDLPSPAYSIAWSPDGHELAVGAFDYNLYLFNSKDGRRTGVFSGHRQVVTQVLFTPAGDKLISTSLDKTIRLWSLSALTQEVFINGYGSEPAMRFAANGREFAATSAASEAFWLSIHDASPVCRTYVNGRAIGRATLVGGLDLSADGKRAVTATYEGIDVWDLEAGRHFGSYDIDPDTEKSVRFGADSETLLIASRATGLSEHRISGTRGDSSLQPVRILDPEDGFIFSNSQTGDPDWIELTSSTKGVARIFDLQKGRDLVRVPGLPEVWDLSVSPDKKYFTFSFSAKAESAQSNTQVWSVRDAVKITTLPGGQNGTARFNHDGSLLKLSGRGSVDHIFSTTDWIPNPLLNCEGGNSIFHPSDQWIAATFSDSVRLWDRLGSQICTLESPLIITRSFRLACSLDGNRLAALSADNILLIWNLEALDSRLRAISPAFRLLSSKPK